jgi:iron(III) transport system substrate-binding protein
MGVGSSRKKGINMNNVKLLFVLAWVVFGIGLSQLALAQTRTDSDPKFEQVAKDFYPKAKQEGALVVYSIWDVEHIRTILAAFSKRFPGINTTYWQGTRSEIIARALTEFEGNQANFDVVLSEGIPLVLRAAGAIEPYKTVQDSSLILHDPTIPVASLQIQVLAYNTKKLKGSDIPKSWEAVVNPKFKGAVALDDPLRAGPLSSMLAGLKDYWKDDARWAKFIKGLKALSVPLHKSTSAMFRLVIAGEYSIAMPTLLHDVVHEKEIGSPVDFVKGAPPVVTAQQAGIYAKAPHMNAGKLFAEWLITPEGQSAIDSVGRSPARKGFKGRASMEVAWGGPVKPIPVVDKLFFEDPKKWLDTNVKPVWDN